MRSRYSKKHTLSPKDVSKVSAPPTGNTKCKIFVLSRRKTRVVLSFRGLMSYTGASCPKEEQVLLLEAKAYPLRRANCLKNNAEFSISS